MKLQIVKASTDQTVNIFIQDSSSTVGAGLTGLVFNSAGLVCYFSKPGAAAAVLALATQTVTGAHTDGGFVEISSANMPGWYRLDLKDSMLTTSDFVSVHLKGATDMAPLPLEIQLTNFNLNSANPDVNVIQISGDSTAANNLEADYDGTGFSKANSTLGTVTTLTGHTAQTGDNFARLGSPAGASVSADIASNNTAITGISNVTRLNIAVPTYLERPASGDKAVRFDFALHDTDGNQEDPDNNALVIKLTNSAGTDLSARLYKENALTTVLDTGSAPFGAFVELERTSTGRYFCFIKVNAADTEEELRMEIGWEEASIELYQFGSTQILDSTNDLSAIKADTAAILIDTADMQPKLGTPVSDISADIATIDANVDSILIDTDTTIPALISALNDLSAAQVNTEVSDVLKVDTVAERGVGLPPVAPTFEEMMSYIYQALRNEVVVNGSDKEFNNDAGTTVYKKALTLVAGVYTEAKSVSG